MEGREDICEDLDYAGFVLEKKHYRGIFPVCGKSLYNNYKNYMSRSRKKGPYIDERLLKKVLKQKETNDNTVIKTWSRACQIPPDFVSHKFGVHNGRKFIEVSVTEAMVGHRLGEFSLTRTFRSHGKVTKKVVEAT